MRLLSQIVGHEEIVRKDAPVLCFRQTGTDFYVRGPSGHRQKTSGPRFGASLYCVKKIAALAENVLVVCAWLKINTTA